jgi:hypothetical protein
MAYQHSYIHQTALSDAVKKLYMLGRRNPGSSSGGDSGFEAMGSAAGGAIAGRAPGDDNGKKRATMENAIKKAKMAQAIQSGTMENAIQHGVMETAKKELSRQRVNEAASRAPFSGEYTPLGFREHMSSVDKTASDHQLSKRLIFQGMQGTSEEDR